MYTRHDLAWLSGDGWQELLATVPPGSPANAAISRWAGADWPLVVRRRDTAPDAGLHDVCLGLAALPDPATGTKLRLPLRVKAKHIARHCAPLLLADVAHALPLRWQTPFAHLVKASSGLDLRIFGSLALQALTGQPYLRDTSDVDLLFRPRDSSELDQGSLLLASHLDKLPLDGEIVFPSGQAVAWKEWFTARAPGERVLVKSLSSVKLGTRAELRAELEPA